MKTISKRSVNKQNNFFTQIYPQYHFIAQKIDIQKLSSKSKFLAFFKKIIKKKS